MIKSFFESFYSLEKTRFVLWIPVCLLYGILLYFGLPFEPNPWIFSLFLIPLLLIKFRFLSIVLFFFMLGIFLPYLKTHYLNTPLLKDKQKNVQIQGVIEALDYNPEKKHQRITIALDQPSNLKKIRINARQMDLKIKDHIKGIASLMPYSDPASAYSYDFRRQAYFLGIGASGTLHSIQEHISSKSTSLEQLRLNINAYIRSKLHGQNAEVTIALTTGFRGGISQDIQNAFTNSGLVHILSISGLHITMVAGLVFLILRRCIALIPFITNRYNTKKMACLLSIPAIFFYTALSGFEYPAIRSFCMTSLVFMAVICDRNPFSMRSIAFSAFVILLFFPESAISVSFQLSFAAVLGLIAFYEVYWTVPKGNKFLAYLLGIVLTTIIATLSTAPFSIYYFKKLTLNAVFANLVAIPLTGFMIMPLAMICILSYFTFELDWPFFLLDCGIGWLIKCAEVVASWQGSQILIPQPKGIYVLLFGFGFLWLCLFKSKIRLFGFTFIILSLLTFFDRSHIPDMYINEQVFGYTKDKVFYVTGKRGNFLYDQWKNEQGFKEIKIDDNHIVPINQDVLLLFRPWEIKGWIDYLPITISNGYAKKHLMRITRKDLKEKGTHLIWLNPFKIQTAKETLGQRPWVIQ